MTVILAIEASRADGTTFRLAFGCTLHYMASWLIGLTRLV
jgi:hypothetical protein